MVDVKIKMTKPRVNLLCIGMTCFLLIVFASLINILFFPYACGLFNMTFPRFCIIYMAVLAGLFFVSHLLIKADTTMLEGYVTWSIPFFLCISFVIMVVCGYLLAHRPFCDNAYVFKGAEMLNRYGKITPEQDEYIYKYLLHFPNQWGFVLLLSFFPFEGMKALFGSDSILYVLSGIQSFLFVMSFGVLLYTIRKCFGIRAQIMLLFSLVLFLPHYSAAAVLYTDTFSMPFALIAICCILYVHQSTSHQQLILLTIGCGVSLLIGSMIKMTCLILFIAAAIVWLLTLRPKCAAVCIIIPLVIFTGGLKVVNHYMENDVFDPDDAARYKTPLLHWVMMSIPTENNFYGSNTNDYDYTWSLMEQGASDEEVMQSIYTRIHEKLNTYRSFKDVFSAVLRKNANYIGDGTLGMWEMLDDDPIRETPLSSFVLYYGDGYPIYADLCGGIWLAYLTMSGIVCFRHIKKHCFSLSVPMISLLGLMIFEMIWESRSRYVFNLAPLVFIITACGMMQPETE